MNKIFENLSSAVIQIFLKRNYSDQWHSITYCFRSRIQRLARYPCPFGSCCLREVKKTIQKQTKKHIRQFNNYESILLCTNTVGAEKYCVYNSMWGI